jgi:hypothetical protein
MKSEYYIFFLIAAMIFLLQFGVPLIVEYFVGEKEHD